MLRQPGLAPADVLLSVTTLSFDIAGLELYLPLVAGARVVIADRATAADPARLQEQTRVGRHDGHAGHAGHLADAHPGGLARARPEYRVPR